MRSTLNERVAGFVLVTFFLLPLAILGYLILTWVVFFGRTARGRAGARALDHFVNAAVFNGYAWESVSSHAWREQHRFRRPAKVLCARRAALPARQQARTAGG